MDAASRTGVGDMRELSLLRRAVQGPPARSKEHTGGSARTFLTLPEAEARRDLESLPRQVHKLLRDLEGVLAEARCPPGRVVIPALDHADPDTAVWHEPPAPPPTPAAEAQVAEAADPWDWNHANDPHLAVQRETLAELASSVIDDPELALDLQRERDRVGRRTPAAAAAVASLASSFASLASSFACAVAARAAAKIASSTPENAIAAKPLPTGTGCSSSSAPSVTASVPSLPASRCARFTFALGSATPVIGRPTTR